MVEDNLWIVYLFFFRSVLCVDLSIYFLGEFWIELSDVFELVNDVMSCFEILFFGC